MVRRVGHECNKFLLETVVTNILEHSCDALAFAVQSIQAEGSTRLNQRIDGIGKNMLCDERILEFAGNAHYLIPVPFVQIIYRIYPVFLNGLGFEIDRRMQIALVAQHGFYVRTRNLGLPAIVNNRCLSYFLQSTIYPFHCSG